MADEEGPVRLDVDGAVALITLARPTAGNALDMAMARALAEIIARCDGDAAIRCVMMTGAGRFFCAGGDVASFAAAGENRQAFIAGLAEAAHDVIKALARLQKPFVTLVNGPAAGVGLSLAIAGDMVLAARGAHFTAAYGGIGLTPDGGMSWRLPRLVGSLRAKEMILTNARVSAERAVEIGLASRVVDDDALMAQGRALAATLSAVAARAWRDAPALLEEGYACGLEAHLDREAASIAVASVSPEGREGVAAFLDKRKPDFTQL